MLLTHPDTYKTGVRVVYLVRRPKDRTVAPIVDAAKRSIFVTHSEKEFGLLVYHLYAKMPEDARIYASLDARNLSKAAFEFRRRQLEASWSESQESAFYRHLESAWHSSLMAPRCRETKLFLWDADTLHDLEVLNKQLDKNGITERYVYVTKSGQGSHVITKPFNTDVLSKNVLETLHRNAMMLWAWK